jgi:hypothetical protein
MLFHDCFLGSAHCPAFLYFVADLKRILMLARLILGHLPGSIYIQSESSHAHDLAHMRCFHTRK